tara:strand:+ start:3706 stop:4743 length:1038 start_codon:yes stop_codon:yes gene_type:complete
MKNIKKSKIYYFFIKLLFIPFYNFFWEYLINIKDKFYKILFCLKRKNIKYFSLNNNSKILVANSDLFKKTANEINKFLDKKFIQEKIDYLKSETYKNKLKESGINDSHALKPFVLNIFDDLNEETKKNILDLVTSDTILKTACKYLGVFPIIARIELNLNIPSNSNARSSQLWHRDDLGYKSLNLFLAINEIDEENGPFVTIEKKDPLNIFYRVQKEINSGLTGERGKILDQDFNYLVDNKKIDQEVIKLKGTPGTALLVDTVRNYHKGGHCKSKYRIMLRFLFLTPDSLHSFEMDEIERKKNKDLIISNDFYKKYLFRKRDKLFIRFNIHEKLFKFYHMISIKK